MRDGTWWRSREGTRRPAERGELVLCEVAAAVASRCAIARHGDVVPHRGNTPSIVPSHTMCQHVSRETAAPAPFATSAGGAQSLRGGDERAFVRSPGMDARADPRQGGRTAARLGGLTVPVRGVASDGAVSDAGRLFPAGVRNRAVTIAAVVSRHARRARRRVYAERHLEEVRHAQPRARDVSRETSRPVREHGALGLVLHRSAGSASDTEGRIAQCPAPHAAHGITNTVSRETARPHLHVLFRVIPRHPLSSMVRTATARRSPGTLSASAPPAASDRADPGPGAAPEPLRDRADPTLGRGDVGRSD